MVTFRLAAYETPLWATLNFAAGRYNDARDGHTQYLSMHPMTPWAELLRNQDRRTPDASLQLRPPLWAIRVILDQEPFRLTFENASEYGLDPEDLVSDNQTPCRELARELRRGPQWSRTLLVPSAALPGTENLVLLDPYVAASYTLEPVAHEDLPLAMAAQDGHCPHGLWDLVHYRGGPEPHAGLQAWRDSEEFIFAEPPVSLGAPLS